MKIIPCLPWLNELNSDHSCIIVIIRKGLTAFLIVNFHGCLGAWSAVLSFWGGAACGGRGRNEGWTGAGPSYCCSISGTAKYCFCFLFFRHTTSWTIFCLSFWKCTFLCSWAILVAISQQKCKTNPIFSSIQAVRGSKMQKKQITDCTRCPVPCLVLPDRRAYSVLPSADRSPAPTHRPRVGRGSGIASYRSHTRDLLHSEPAYPMVL